jgi:sigma-B regulation protein RsbU (phosphoserine phosphatase)
MTTTTREWYNGRSSSCPVKDVLPEMLVRLPIKILAPLLFGLPVLVVGLCLSVMWRRQSQRAVVELADQNIGQIHDMIATKIADVLSTPVRICQLNDHLVHSGALDPEDLPAWRPTFVQESRAFDTLSAISWGGADGRAAWVSRYPNGATYWAVKDDPTVATMNEWRLDKQGHISDEPTNSFEFELASRPWFQTPHDAKQATWSEPFVWVGGMDSQEMTLGISYGIPLYAAGGKLIGIVDADYSLNDLSGFLSSLKIGKTGLAVLATRDGRLLATSSDASIITPAGQRMNAYDSTDPRIVAAANLIGGSKSVLDSHAEIGIDGETHYLRASHVGKKVGLDWTLVTVISEKDFTAAIESEFQRSFVTSLIAVALAIAIGLVAARWLVAPLVKLVTAVRRIGQGDLETRVHIRHAPEYANLAAEINRMTVGLQDRMRMQKSLSLAMEVQRNLLPTEAPHIHGLDIAGHSTYCDETGGDYYDFLDVSGAESDTAVVVIGDVMGHGVAAALLMATARGILRSRCAVPGSLADFLNHLNDMLVIDTHGERFMTMLLVTIPATREELRWASAGHGAPLVFNPTSNDFLEIDGGGMPLGLVEGERYSEYVRPGITPGSIVLASTDGLIETADKDGILYGTERLLQLLRDHAHQSAEDISEAIRESLAQYRGPAAQDDDLTFVVVKVL